MKLVVSIVGSRAPRDGPVVLKFDEKFDDSILLWQVCTE